jgi:predicted lactoylglutathione lyase
MPQMIFVNLPVTHLSRSIAFYEAVGAKKNPAFSDDTAACMVLSENIYVMLLTHAKFSGFTTRQIPDAHQSAQMMLALSQENPARVDALTEAAAQAGGMADPNPKQEYAGFMYGRSFADPDGHIWEVFWMDPVAAAGGQPG